MVLVILLEALASLSAGRRPHKMASLLFAPDDHASPVFILGPDHSTQKTPDPCDLLPCLLRCVQPCLCLRSKPRPL